MNTKEKLQKVYDDFQKPGIQTVVKFLAPLIISGVKYIINKVKTHADTSEATQVPESTTSSSKPPVEVATVNPASVPIAPVVCKTYDIIWYPSPNYSSRRDTAIKAIIIHHTGPGTTMSQLSWLTDKTSGVSAHYVIDRDGKIYQLVKDENKAWHAGESELNSLKDVNTFSIGIELVGNGVQEFTSSQLEATAFLCKKLKRRYTIENNWIVGHAAVALPIGRKTDPSPFSFQALFAEIEKLS